ncbi:MAG: SPFH domain-containing protein [Bacteroidetes bacterium]|nr:antifreeze protein [Rhodothermaceae bacterium RA]RMH49458.1 MAG: SPFH domain-containing protein [Bacteroidota bacterium]
MSLWRKIKGELIDIIEWLDDSRDTMVYRFERYDNEIKYGAKLIVREGQAAVFVNKGALADVFPPGTYTLQTDNLPVLSTLQGWKHGFESPFKAEVYFVNTRQFTDLKWGTRNPIMLRDPEFGPIRLRAFGTYAIRVSDPGTFIREIVGTDGHFTADGITNQLRNLVVSRFTDVLAESRLAALDLAANYDELGDFVAERIRPDFQAYGLELTSMLVENISLPPAVEEALDKRTSMGVIGNLGAYTQYQAAQAMEQAAKNPAGGGAAEGMGLGMGFAMAGQMAQGFGQAAQPASPPPPPPPVAFHVAVDGQTTGPFDVNTLAQQARAGQFTPDSLVWKAGFEGWKRAGDVPELQAVFAQTPPPPPPSAS